MSLKKLMPVSRREALSVLGMGAIGMVAGCGSSSTAPPPASMPVPSPRLIIRTILGDVPAEQLADGATLFHEHMSLNNQFWLDLGLERFIDPGKPYFMEDMDNICKNNNYFLTLYTQLAKSGKIVQIFF